MTNNRTNTERSPPSQQMGETPTQAQGNTEDDSPSQQQSQPESREETLNSTNAQNAEPPHQPQQQHNRLQQRESQQSQQEQQTTPLLQVRSPQPLQEQRQDHSPQRHRQRQSPSPHRHSRHSEQYVLPSESQHHHHQQASTVLVVQQPIILGRGAYVRRGHPFMYRGVHLGSGSKIGMNCMLTLGVGGATLVVLGAVYGVDKMQGFFLVLTGAILVATTLRLCYKAKQDFDALPQDHPDRVTYSSPIVLTREAREIASTTTTYQLPPGAQVINTSPIHGAHMAPTYQLPAGAQVISSTSTLGPRLAPPATLQPSGAVAYSRAFDFEDKPPSYDEVCKNLR